MSSPAIMRLMWVVESCNRVEAEWNQAQEAQEADRRAEAQRDARCELGLTVTVLWWWIGRWDVACSWCVTGAKVLLCRQSKPSSGGWRCCGHGLVVRSKQPALCWQTKQQPWKTMLLPDQGLLPRAFSTPSSLFVLQIPNTMCVR